jgi:hypothetical protein
MDPDRAGGRDVSDSPWWRSRRVLALCAAFAAPLVLLVFANSPLIVPAIYTALAVEGDAIICLAIWRSQSVDGRKILGEDRGGPVGNRTFPSADRVEALASYAEWAGKGSDFSRREMAQTIARILGRSYAASPSGGPADGGELSRGGFRTVIYPYRDDPVVRSEIGVIGGGGEGEEKLNGPETAVRERPPKVDRSGYLAGLEEVVSKLERDLDRSGDSGP